MDNIPRKSYLPKKCFTVATPGPLEMRNLRELKKKMCHGTFIITLALSTSYTNN